MTTHHHTPYQDGVTTYRASDMNAPLGELDEVLHGVSGEVLNHTHTLGQVSGEYPYDIGITYAGSPGNSAVLLRFPLPRPVQFAIDMGPSKGVAGTAASGEAVFCIKKDGVQFATATFASGETAASFSGEATSFASGEILTLVAPASADPNLADLGFALSGIRN